MRRKREVIPPHGRLWRIGVAIGILFTDHRGEEEGDAGYGVAGEPDDVEHKVVEREACN